MLLLPPVVDDARMAALMRPTLKTGQIAKIVQEGGRTVNGLGKVVLIVRNDGRVDRLRPYRHDAFRLAPAELTQLKTTIARLSLPELLRGKRSEYRPSAADGMDVTVLFRQVKSVRIFPAYDYDNEILNTSLLPLNELWNDKPNRKVVVLAEAKPS